MESPMLGSLVSGLLVKGNEDSGSEIETLIRSTHPVHTEENKSKMIELQLNLITYDYIENIIT